MNLNDLDRFRELDTHDMRSQLDRLPDQLEAAWIRGQLLPLSSSFERIERIVIAGMGTAALAGDMLAVLVAGICNVPILIHRGYDLPAYADGQGTLVIAISSAGDDEEVLQVLELADMRGAQILVIAAGGPLVVLAEKIGALAWTFDHTGPARTALGWLLGLLTAFVSRLGLVPDLSGDVAETVEILRGRVPILGIDGPVVKNPAKRLAGQLIGRVPIIHGAGILAPVARRWKMQLNENGKTVAQWEELPEMNHSSLGGISFPPPIMTKVAAIFLVAPHTDQPRITLRESLTQTLYLQAGLAPDVIKARGNSLLAQMMSTVQYGDYVSYYVAMAYGVDPTPTPEIADLKEKLSAAKE
jgi:glucose/mannose-6-phosphate isomerase